MIGQTPEDSSSCRCTHDVMQVQFGIAVAHLGGAGTGTTSPARMLPIKRDNFRLKCGGSLAGISVRGDATSVAMSLELPSGSCTWRFPSGILAQSVTLVSR